jgi:hypothetical protein
MLAAENIALVGPPSLLDTTHRYNDLSAGGNQDGGVDDAVLFGANQFLAL